MAGKTHVFEADFLKLLFNGTPIANIADNAGTSPLGDLYLSLHTADPTDDATAQTTGETAYVGYTRIPVARTTAGWVVTQGSGITKSSVSPAATVSFPKCTAGSSTVTHVAIGTSVSGAGKMLFSGELSPSISVATGVVPQITTASTITED